MQATTQSRAELRDRARDPAQFQRYLLSRRLWQKQRDITHAAATRRATAVKGCHASGKTFVISGAVLHHLALYPKGKVITVAPTLRQVRLMWEEVELARRGGRIAFPECSTTGLRITEERYGIGFSSSKGVNVQGFHGQDVLIITDESPGISGEVWDAIEGISAGGNVRRVSLGNPTVPSGKFFDDFTRDRRTTHCITISAFDTPNLQNLAAGRPYTIEELLAMSEDKLNIAPEPFLVTRHWVKEKYLRWGPNNPRYRSRVLAEFPSQSEHSVFSLEWVERARREPTELELERAKTSIIQVGVDVAGPGDDETTACARVNGVIVSRQAWADKDPRGPVLRWLNQMRLHPVYQLGPVVIDIIGIGYNFALHVRDHGFNVMGFNAARQAFDPEQFLNAKAEAYWRLRDMYKENYVCHLDGTVDEETEAQLSAVQYKETSRGLIQIEPKEDARKRGVPSPDRAEAEVMAFCRVQPREETITIGEDYQISPI